MNEKHFIQMYLIRLKPNVFPNERNEFTLKKNCQKLMRILIKMRPNIQHYAVLFKSERFEQSSLRFDGNTRVVSDSSFRVCNYDKEIYLKRNLQNTITYYWNQMPNYDRGNDIRLKSDFYIEGVN